MVNLTSINEDDLSQLLSYPSKTKVLMTLNSNKQIHNLYSEFLIFVKLLSNNEITK